MLLVPLFAAMVPMAIADPDPLPDPGTPAEPPADAPPPVDAPAPRPQPPPPEAPPAHPQPPPPGSGVHLRFGLGADLAALGTPDLVGLGLGAQARLGLQLSPWFAIYYQPHAIGGVIVTGPKSAAFVGAIFNTAMFELDLPVLELGLGPSWDVLGLAGCQLGATNCGSGSGRFFGLDFRAALRFGPHGPGTHGGLALEADLHPTFLGRDTLTAFTIGLGGDFY